MKYGTWDCIASREFNGEDIVVTDPFYLDHDSKETQEIDTIISWTQRHGLVSDTFYGDWGCTMFYASDDIPGFVPKKAKKFGNFCADAGMVCAVGMNDVKKKFPKFENWLKEHKWCGTIVPKFTGTVRFMAKTEPEEYKFNGKVEKYDETELRVRMDGKSNGEKISLESVQTSA